jgi:integrase
MSTTLQALPDSKTIRERIDKSPLVRVKYALRFQYLTGSRISEVCGNYSPTGRDLELGSYDEHPVALFRIRSAKKKERIRICALPLEEEFEPWTRLLVDWFEKREDRKTFPLAPSTLQRFAPQVFKGLTYEIEPYLKIGEHSRRIVTHGLRHIRATELLGHYGFTGVDLAVFFGWVLPGLPRMSERYLSLQWGEYFPKLLKSRSS